jgi:hypothetical protein
MRKDLLILALGLFVAAGTATGEELAVPETPSEAPAADAPPDVPAEAPTDAPADVPAPAAAPVSLPAKGITMKAVRKQFGEPDGKRGPVGGNSPKHPPITRWDYAAFSVIFENDRVVDAVVPGAPPKLRTTAGLTRAVDAPPLPLPAAPMETPAAPAPEPEPMVPEAPAETPPPDMEPTAEAPPAEPEAPAEAPPAEAAPAEQPAALEPPPAEPVTPEPQSFPEDERPPTPK